MDITNIFSQLFGSVVLILAWLVIGPLLWLVHGSIVVGTWVCYLYFWLVCIFRYIYLVSQGGESGGGDTVIKTRDCKD